MNYDPCTGHWFALQIRPGREQVSAAALRYKGYQEFLPLETPRSTRRRKVNPAPLFPGYLFCRAGDGVFGPLVTTPGVIRIVGFGNRPEPIPNQEIESIRRISESGLAGAPHPYLEVGKRVRITEGPLAGTEGILLSHGRNAQLVVSVTLLRRSVTVSVDEAWVSPDENRNVQLRAMAS
jgi:transcriptional antiterminator RfaH